MKMEIISKWMTLDRRLNLTPRMVFVCVCVGCSSGSLWQFAVYAPLHFTFSDTILIWFDSEWMWRLSHQQFHFNYAVRCGWWFISFCFNDETRQKWTISTTRKRKKLEIPRRTNPYRVRDHKLFLGVRVNGWLLILWHFLLVFCFTLSPISHGFLKNCHCSPPQPPIFFAS